ncbi:MAG TPA: hypothetical protein VFL67_19650 [Mycobacterium sp.]|nr:hypothetical protein [Mycobacterium sp.]
MSETLSTTNVSRGAARFVGRVGALAVALGIGVAIANNPAVALADEGGSDPSSSSSAGQSSSSESNDNAASTGTTKTTGSTRTTGTTKTKDTKPDQKADETKTAGDRASEAAADADAEEIGPYRPNKRIKPTLRTSAATATADRVAQTAADPSSEPAERDDAPDSQDPDAQDPDSQDTVVHTLAAAEEDDTTGTAGAAEAVAAKAAPAAPAPEPAPALWATLAWARREIGHMANPASNPAGTGTVATTTGTSTSTTSAAPVEPAVSITATSPLGTQQQLDAERIAWRTVNTLPVALMKVVLLAGFQAAANQQFSEVGGPDRANLGQLGAAIDEYAMAAAFQQQLLNSNAPTVVMQVAPGHTWYGQRVPGSRILYDNPDTVYRFMGVNGASSYVIRGRFEGEVPADTTFSVLTGLTGNTASVLTKDELVINPDGTFTITADRNPANGRVNHLQLTSDSTIIATRNTLADWGTEVPMSLEIKRVGGPPNSLFSQLGGFAIPGLGKFVVENPLLTTLVSLIPPLPYEPPLLRGIFTAVIMALGIQREATYMAVATTDPVTGERIPPNVLKNPTRNAEFLATQLQSAGYFQLADDEALVVTIDPGNAGYFVVPVTNDWTISKDYWNQQTSLNNAQALVNDDLTTYTVVISKSDPGVANWVSTGGLNQGTISMRFQDLDPNAPDDLPTVTSRVVKLSELDGALPDGTVYYTPAQRAAQLAERKAGFDNRFAPYPQP